MPALLTPFTATGELDIAAHAHNLGVLASAGINGFVLAGSTGEGPYLESGERKKLVATARTELSDEVFVICGVHAESVRQALAMVDEIAGAGGDAALVVTPTTLVRERDHAVAHHFTCVADSSDLPILLYSVPPVTGYEIPTALVLDLAAHDNIVGIKDSGGRPERIKKWSDAVHSSFRMFAGASRAVSASMQAGAYGAITASGNYAWELIAAAGSDAEGAGHQQEALTHLTKAVESHGIPGTKVAAAIRGLEPGKPRLPLQEPDAEAMSVIRNLVEDMLAAQAP